MDTLLAAGRGLLGERPCTAAELRRLLGPRWPERDPAALAYAIRGLLPVVLRPTARHLAPERARSDDHGRGMARPGR